MSVFDLKKVLLGSTLFVGAAAFAIPATAYAQDEEEDDVAQIEESAPEAEASDDVVVITGSRLRRDEFTSSSPIEVITAEEATLEGLIDTAAIIQGSSVASGSVQYNNQFSGYVVEGGTGINSVSLRGLGAQRSLVLVNGKRPGPSGTRGQVGSFDLNVIPKSIVQRVEILKDGASSVYGSDAVAGVVNLITLTSVERPTLTIQYNKPEEPGGESLSLDGAIGFNNFDNGSIALAAQYEKFEDLSMGDRDYLKCPQDRYYDATTGERIDRENRSVLAGTRFDQCSSSSIYFNTAISAITGARYIPSPDGVTDGPIPGYRPRVVGRYDTNGQAYYEDVIHDVRALEADAINATERMSLYGVADFDFDFLGGVNWLTEAIYTKRKTRAEGIRQFFPYVGGATAAYYYGDFYGYANDPDWDENPLYVAQPVLIHPSNAEVEIDYLALTTEFSGEFGGSGFFADWGWDISGTYSRSDGDYTFEDQIFADQSGDVQYDADAPVFDYFSPEILSGFYPDNYFETLGGDVTGNTVYEQSVLTGFVSGDLFELPAGDVLLAVGAEYRGFSIKDVPSDEAIAGNLWGFTSAQVTEGEDNVSEIFGEIEVPILKGLPAVEELTFTGSARAFDYESTGSGDVYKVGLNWQVVPEIRLRATQGTSFRAPALYELFLGNQSSFVGQSSIDPCIDWGQSNNEYIRANCAADGIPDDYNGVGSSATVFSGGGGDNLNPETSEAMTMGVVFTPEFMPLSLAIDYFEIEVIDQIGTLGAGDILYGCYNSENFPNTFCDLFDRGTPSSPYGVNEVESGYLNIDEQSTRGIDATVRYEQDFDFGTLMLNGNATWTLEDVYQLFDSAQVSGFDEEDFNRTIGDPDVVASFDARLRRGDWTYSWFTDFVGHTSNEPFAARETTYSGRDAVRINETEAVWYHDASVRWQGDKLTITGGVTNIFNEEPPVISASAGSRRGDVPLVGTQYDLRGRTFFVRATKDF